MRLKLGHSPDADDAFLFYALSSGKVAFEGLDFEFVLEDIQTLNDWAVEGKLEVTALSVHAYAYAHEHYSLLTAGFSMGEGYGPALVSAAQMRAPELVGSRIAVPGGRTTAFLVLGLMIGDYVPLFCRFDEVAQQVLEGRAAAGVLIHEGQLTHQAQGLHLVADVGKWWQDSTGYPLPLGAVAVRKDLPEQVASRVCSLVRASAQYAMNNRQQALEHAMTFARGISPEQTETFVGMYVNERTLDCGRQGREAVAKLFLWGQARRMLPGPVVSNFVSPAESDVEG